MKKKVISAVFCVVVLACFASCSTSKVQEPHAGSGMNDYAKLIFEAVRTNDAERIINTIVFSDEEFFCFFYFAVIELDFDSLPHLSDRKMKGIFSKMTDMKEKKLLKEIQELRENFIEGEPFGFTRLELDNMKLYELYRLLVTSILEDGLARIREKAQKFGISWESAKFERCFFSLSDNLYIVFQEGGKRYFFEVNSVLLQNGWICSENIGPLRWEFDKYHSLEEIEDCADFYPIGESRPEPVKIEPLADSIGIELVSIPPGSFMMGSPDDEVARLDYEGPVHKVTFLKPFKMGKFEVLQTEYDAVMRNTLLPKGNRLPANQVSWNDAMKFCKIITEREHKAGTLASGMKYSLPTEAQWEYCCRAGSTNAFYWGDKWDDAYGWIKKNSKDKRQEVGGRKPNAWGLYDMIGNLNEWCLDWSGDYLPAEQFDPLGPSTGCQRAQRGGRYYSSFHYCRSASRGYFFPDSRNPGSGFRVVVVGSGK